MRRHLLKAVRIDGTQDGEVFVRSGGAFWAKTPAGHGEIGSHLALRLPQSDCRLLAAPSPGLVLALCRPGSGEFVEYSANNSRLSGEKPMLTLSLARTDSAGRRAVLRWGDPRTVVSFGTGPAKGE